jgi:hypothetical protein
MGHSSNSFRTGFINGLVEPADRLIGFGWGLLLWGLTDAARPGLILIASGVLVFGYIASRYRAI